MAEKLSASLRAGTYDAGANILRTCSLPDLTALVVPTEPQEVPSQAWKAEEQSKEVSKIDSQEGEVVSSEQGLPDADEVKVPSYSVRQGHEASGNEDSVFYEGVASAAEGKECEGEGRSEGGSSGEEEEEEDEWSSSEDEDLRQLVQTLQSFVEEISEL